jgi:hypothetical protein
MGKVSRRTQELINRFITSKLFTIIVHNRLDSRNEGFKLFNNGGTDLIRRLAINLSHHCIAAFSLNQRDDGMLVGSYYDVSPSQWPMWTRRSFDSGRRVMECLSGIWPSRSRPPAWRALLLLAAQGAPQISAHRIVWIDLMLIRLVANRQLTGNLFGTPWSVSRDSTWGLICSSMWDAYC